MFNIIAVFFGGGLGAVLRYLVNIFCERYIDVNLPIATLGVNIVGSLILGVLLAFFAENSTINPVLKIFLTCGFCGGLTTFSTFSFEVFDFIYQGNFLMAFVYATISFIVCVGFVAIGFCWVKNYV